MKKIYRIKFQNIKTFTSGWLFFLIIIYLITATCSKNPEEPDNIFNYPDSLLRFTVHIQPIFLSDCASGPECHQSLNPANGLDLASADPTFVSFNRVVVFPNDAENSPLYRVLLDRYQGIPRMPFQRAPLPQEKITAIRTWINEGAKTTN